LLVGDKRLVAGIGRCPSSDSGLRAAGSMIAFDRCRNLYCGTGYDELSQTAF
jgi:hypothetical protein